MESICECCGEVVPKFENLTPENEKIVRQTYRDIGPISAIKKLREITNSGLKEAKQWIDHCDEYYQGKTIPCPYCGELLITEKAKQCRHCKRDWHDENNLKWLE